MKKKASRPKSAPKSPHPTPRLHKDLEHQMPPTPQQALRQRHQLGIQGISPEVTHSI